MHTTYDEEGRTRLPGCRVSVLNNVLLTGITNTCDFTSTVIRPLRSDLIQHFLPPTLLSHVNGGSSFGLVYGHCDCQACKSNKEDACGL